MIWLIIGGVISIALIVTVIIWAFQGGENIKERLGSSIISCFFAILISGQILCISSLLAMGLGSMLHGQVATVKNISASQEIVALKDSNNISGKFYLGSGYINESAYYHYMVQGENGLDMKRIKTDKCSLQFDENPRIETITYKFKNPILNWIAIDSTEDYIIHCPEGTIDYSFQVDLQ